MIKRMDVAAWAAWAALACGLPGPAAATAQLGGSIGVAFVAGSGSCNRSRVVPLDTQQDSFALAVSSTCVDGSSASGELRADAASGSIGMQLSAGGLASAAGEVRYFDRWALAVAPGTLPGTYTLPVDFRLDGSVTAGAFARLGGNFLRYSVAALDPTSALQPALFSAGGNVSATGAFGRDITGTVDLIYRGPGSALPPTLEVEIILLAPQIEGGTLDFLHTATLGLQLPAGWSATTSSGLALPFGSAAAVPEPSALALMLLGLAGLGLVWRRPGPGFVAAQTGRAAARMVRASVGTGPHRPGCHRNLRHPQAQPATGTDHGLPKREPERRQAAPELRTPQQRATGDRARHR